MSILVNKRSRIVMHGVGDAAGRLHAAACRGYGHGRRCVAAAVAPELAGRQLDGIPVFGSLVEARAATGATACVVHAQGDALRATLEEAAEAGMALVVCVADGVSADGVAGLRDRLQASGTRLLGPGCAGLLTPGEVRIGALDIEAPQPGRLGIVARSPGLVPDVARQLAKFGLGASTVVSLSGQRPAGLAHLELLQLFEQDPGTDAVLLLGPIDAEDEAACAAWLAAHMRKPVVGFLDGPVGARLRASGVHVTRDPQALGSLVASVVEPPWLPFD